MSSVRKIKSKYRGHRYPDGIVNIKGLDLDNILVYERSYQRNFICQSNFV